MAGVNGWMRKGAVALVATVMSMASAAQVALADIVIDGNTTLQGYKPDEMVNTDMNFGTNNVSELAPTLSEKLVEVVKLGLPFLAILSVGVIIYNAVYNAFMPDEDPHEAAHKGHRIKRPMGEVLMSIFKMFFWILFAWIIVEAIIWVVTSLEVFTQQTLTK